jgi:septal ring factor EnvC (AmiA/AmiB activator)
MLLSTPLERALQAVAQLPITLPAIAQMIITLLVYKPCAASLQAVGQRQKESLLARLAEADKQLAAAAKERTQLEAQLTRVCTQLARALQAMAQLPFNLRLLWLNC